MSTALVAAWYQAAEAADGSAARLVPDDFVAHLAGFDAPMQVLTGMRAQLLAGFPDFSVTHTILHHTPEFAVVRTRTRGTHARLFMGHPPTGKEFVAEGLEAFRLEGDRIAELWASFDTEGMLRQLGLRGP
jgi:predicted ester cyclase